MLTSVSADSLQPSEFTKFALPLHKHTALFLLWNQAKFMQDAPGHFVRLLAFCNKTVWLVLTLIRWSHHHLIMWMSCWRSLDLSLVKQPHASSRANLAHVVDTHFYHRTTHFCLSSYLIFLSHDIYELHHFDEVVTAEGVVHNMGGKNFVLPVSPLTQGQLSHWWTTFWSVFLWGMKWMVLVITHSNK